MRLDQLQLINQGWHFASFAHDMTNTLKGMQSHLRRMRDENSRSTGKISEETFVAANRRLEEMEAAYRSQMTLFRSDIRDERFMKESDIQGMHLFFDAAYRFLPQTTFVGLADRTLCVGFLKYREFLGTVLRMALASAGRLPRLELFVNYHADEEFVVGKLLLKGGALANIDPEALSLAGILAGILKIPFEVTISRKDMIFYWKLSTISGS
ncbi:MAG: hypothetical protein EXS36_19980 [Pedosphaera sp.]|nr:hypothetical protein [Pedosphaera sp.]